MRRQKVWFPIVLIVLLLAAGCGEVPTVPPAGPQPSPTEEAYPPPPEWTPEPTAPPLPTMTPVPTVPTTPTPTRVPGPPKPTPLVTPIVPFPTPALSPTPVGEPPPGLQMIWYPYLAAPDGQPLLQAVLVDEQGRRWGELGRAIELGLEAPGYPGSTMLYALHVSPDGRSFVADVGYEHIRSLWVNPSSGEVGSVAPDRRNAHFVAWGPDYHVFVDPGGHEEERGEIWLVDLNTQEHQVFIFPVSEYGFPLVRDIALSPNGSWIADASHYDRAQGDDVEIGLQPLVGRDRTALAVISIPQEVTILGLMWSADGQSLALTLLTGMGDGDPSNNDVQLWLIDAGSGAQTVLAHGLYRTRGWSPDGRYIAFTRGKKPGQEQSPIDLWLFDLATVSEIQLTDYADRRVTSAVWSPDGQRLAFGVTMSGYGEIWITSLDGSEQYPVAGPTPHWPQVPVVWLAAMEGGQ